MEINDKYFDNFYDLFASEGWKQVVEEVERTINANNDVTSIDTPEDLYKRQGRLEILNYIANLPTVIENLQSQMGEKEQDEY